MYYIVGLGNPGEEYKLSRHNTGRIVLGRFMKNRGIGELEYEKKLKALTGGEKIALAERGKYKKFQIIFPETFMNKSGLSLKPITGKIVKKKKACHAGRQSLSLAAENLIVVHDDIDLALGKFKISVGKGSGGHKGVESIIKNLKTKNFIRIRVGVSPSSSHRTVQAPFGKPKKPQKEKILNFIIGNFKPKEMQVLKKTAKKIASALEMILEEGVGKAMNVYN